MIPLPYKLLGVALAILALGAAALGYGHYQYLNGVKVTTNTFDAAIAQQKAKASETLAVETDKVRDKELALQRAKNKQELTDVQQSKVIADMARQLRAAGGLHDPHAARCGGGSGGTPGSLAGLPSAGANDGAEAGQLLSTDLTELLLRLTREADEINLAYASCKADSKSIRGN